ncbi:MAG: molybdopterin-dependent oxidoreductase [Ardenticatenia bacterium]|nr:molybdopterin-dependent oxidoreductase [Ardenticatenia bacterium]
MLAISLSPRSWAFPTSNIKRSPCPTPTPRPTAAPPQPPRQTYINGQRAARMAAQRVRGYFGSGRACEALGAPQAELRLPRRPHITARRARHGRARPLKHGLEAGRRPVARAQLEAPPTQPLGQGGDMHAGFSFGVQAAPVEVDTSHGGVWPCLAVVNAHDIGRAHSLRRTCWGVIRGALIHGRSATPSTE